MENERKSGHIGRSVTCVVTYVFVVCICIR